MSYHDFHGPILVLSHIVHERFGAACDHASLTKLPMASSYEVPRSTFGSLSGYVIASAGSSGRQRTLLGAMVFAMLLLHDESRAFLLDCRCWGS